MDNKRLHVVWIIMFLTLMLIVSLDCFGEELPITAHQQQQGNWCWAACSETVLNYYGTSTQQCQMANYVFGQETCCIDGTSTSCNRGTVTHSLFDYFGVKGIQSVIKHFGKVDSAYRPWAVKLDSPSYAFWAHPTLTDQMKAKAPWIIVWKLLNTGLDEDPSHSLLGYGLSGTTVSYMDPDPAVQTLNREDYGFVKSWPDHEWDQTLLIEPKKIAFLIDNTGSMADNIGPAKAAAKQIVDENEEAGEHFLYTLITFMDGAGHLFGTTMDPDEIKGWIDGVYADAGGGCQESSLTAVRQAANLIPDSEIFLMTDANSNSYGQDGTYATAGEILDTADILIKQNVDLYPIIYGDCGGYAYALHATSTCPSTQQGCNTAASVITTRPGASSALDSGVGGYEHLSNVSVWMNS